MPNKTQEVINALTKKVLHLMKTEGSKWTKSWANKTFVSVDGWEYSGINTLWLSFTGYKRLVYGTYKQWAKHQCQVKKGEKSTKLVFFKQYIKDAEFEDKRKVIRLTRAFDVFNIEQVEGNIEKFVGFDTKTNLVNDIDKAETFISNTKVKIQDGTKACYIPSQDYITMPTKDSFINTQHSTATENYYTTLLHELTHWTGHKDRCNRELSTRFGSTDYAFEELVAELGSCFMATHLNITSHPREDHAHYLNSWIKCLEEHEDAIWKASSLASKAMEYCKSLQQSQTTTIKEVA